MNSVNLVGRLTKDPKIVERGGRTVCEMRVAADNPGQRTTYIEVRSFDEEAYACAEYLVKGQRVAVSGRLLYDQWNSPTGELCEQYKVIGRVDFLDLPTQSAAARSKPSRLTRPSRAARNCSPPLDRILDPPPRLT